MIVVDFSGTLIDASVVEEANLMRYSLLGLPEPTEDEHKRLHATKGHYDVIKERIAKDYGITDDMGIDYVQNYGDEITLSGKDVKTIMMTDLFRNAMYLVAKKHGISIFREGMLAALQELVNRGYKLAIVSGIRTDIITGMLSITKCPIKFDQILGQDPVLSRDNSGLLGMLEEPVSHIIGDKQSDLEPAGELGAKTIFLKGGHPTGDEKADHVIEKPTELLDILA
ncbi:MAG: HAD hydrolase-like protein [Candidatus Woesearchaeota archaeon]